MRYETSIDIFDNTFSFYWDNEIDEIIKKIIQITSELLKLFGLFNLLVPPLTLILQRFAADGNKII